MHLLCRLEVRLLEAKGARRIFESFHPDHRFAEGAVEGLRPPCYRHKQPR